MQVVQAMDAGGGFLGHAADRVALRGEPAGACGKTLADLGEQRLFLFGLRGGDQVGFARLDPRAHQDIQRGIAAVVQDHVGGAVGELEDAVGIGPVFRQRLALDREHRNAGGGDRGGGVVLCRIDVAGRPADVRTQRDERLDQDGGLDRHVQRSGDPRPGERFRRAVFLPQRHQAGHFGFRDIQFLAAIVGQRDVADDRTVFGLHGKGLTQNGCAPAMSQPAHQRNEQRSETAGLTDQLLSPAERKIAEGSVPSW